jgi:hypothetical protein
LKNEGRIAEVRALGWFAEAEQNLAVPAADVGEGELSDLGRRAGRRVPTW